LPGVAEHGCVDAPAAVAAHPVHWFVLIHVSGPGVGENREAGGWTVLPVLAAALQARGSSAG
jgi:hypothetical protein